MGTGSILRDLTSNHHISKGVGFTAWRNLSKNLYNSSHLVRSDVYKLQSIIKYTLRCLLHYMTDILDMYWIRQMQVT